MTTYLIDWARDGRDYSKKRGDKRPSLLKLQCKEATITMLIKTLLLMTLLITLINATSYIYLLCTVISEVICK